MTARDYDHRDYSREFGAYFIAVLSLACGLFYLLDQTGLGFLRGFWGGWLEEVAQSLIPSIAAILAVALGGMKYARMGEEQERKQEARPAKSDGPGSDAAKSAGPKSDGAISGALRIQPVRRTAVGDACYYMGFLLTLWGLFLELINLGSSLRNGGLALIGDGLIGDLIAGNGLALLSTIIGLVSRFIIHRFFQPRSGEADATDRLLDEFKKHADGSREFREEIRGMGLEPQRRSEVIPPAGPQITIRTHAISADVDARHGKVQVGDMREVDGLYQRIHHLEREVSLLRAIRNSRRPRRGGRVKRWTGSGGP